MSATAHSGSVAPLAPRWSIFGSGHGGADRDTLHREGTGHRLTASTPGARGTAPAHQASETEPHGRYSTRGRERDKVSLLGIGGEGRVDLGQWPR